MDQKEIDRLLGMTSDTESPEEVTQKASLAEGENSALAKSGEKDSMVEEEETDEGIKNAAIERLTNVTNTLHTGDVNGNIKVAEGELEELSSAINQTILNIQQMDSSLKESKKDIPNLAHQLDCVSKDTEAAANNILNKLDSMLNISDENVSGLKTINEKYEKEFERFKKYTDSFEDFHKTIALDKQISEKERLEACQKVGEFLSLFSEDLKQQIPIKKELEKDIQRGEETAINIQSTILDIFNEFQFQDITRQKIQRIMLLLKEVEMRIERLLVVFNIKKPPVESTEKVFRVSKHIESVTLETDSKKESVDDIVGNFFNNT